MFEQAHSLLLDKLIDHIAEHRTNGVETLVGLADVREPNIVEQDLLYDKDGDRLAELRARLHDPQAQRDDLGSKEEIDDLRGVVLDKSADNAEGGEAEVLKRSRLRRGVEEWIEKQRNVGCSS